MVKPIGVVATPEVLDHPIKPEDCFVILASDGIWDFLTSQEACEIVLESQNPLQAAHQLIQTAWSRWLEWDDRIDDITATVLFIDAEAATTGNNPWAKAAAESTQLNAALGIACAPAGSKLPS